MKKLSYLAFLLVLACTIMACQGENSSNAASDAATTAAPAAPAAPALAGAVDHYTCPNGHPGAPAAGNCVECGTALVHNQAFHANDPATPAPAAGNPMQQFAPGAAATNGTTTITPPAPTTPSPAQNAAGVFHYTCSSGCAGGAGAAGNCASCGSALAHNQAYHN